MNNTDKVSVKLINGSEIDMEQLMAYYADWAPQVLARMNRYDEEERETRAQLSEDKEQIDYQFSELLDMDNLVALGVDVVESVRPDETASLDYVEGGEDVYHDDVLIQTLATVGVVPVIGTALARVGMMNRDFTALARTDLYVDEEIIMHWDIPLLGADTLTQSSLANIQINGPNAIIHGTGQSSVSVMAVREKLDGVEAVQFVAITATGRRVGFLWCQNTIRRVAAVASAHYEYMMVGDRHMYFLHSGVPSDSIPVLSHSWQMVSNASVSSGLSTEGLMVLANGLEYRVKNKKTVTLRRSGKNLAMDANQTRYQVREMPKDFDQEFFEAEWMSINVVRFMHSRLDRDCADSRAQIATVISAVTVNDLLLRVPKVLQYSLSPCELFMISPVQNVTIEQHRLDHRLHGNYGPYTWSKYTDKVDVEYAAQEARLLLRLRGRLGEGDVQRELMFQGRYISGPRVFSYKKRLPLKIRAFRCVVRLEGVKYSILVSDRKSVV